MMGRTCQALVEERLAETLLSFSYVGANSVQVSQPSHTAPCWKAYCAHGHVSCSISMYGIHASSVCQYHTGKKGMSNCSEE